MLNMVVRNNKIYMIVIGSLAHEGEDVEMELFGVIEMGQKLPSQIDACGLYAEGGNKVINLRRRRDGEHIKEEQKRKDRHEKYPIPKEKNDKA